MTTLQKKNLRGIWRSSSDANDNIVRSWKAYSRLWSAILISNVTNRGCVGTTHVAEVGVISMLTFVLDGNERMYTLLSLCPFCQQRDDILATN